VKLKKYSLIIPKFDSFKKEIAEGKMFTWPWEEVTLDVIWAVIFIIKKNNNALILSARDMAKKERK